MPLVKLSVGVPTSHVKEPGTYYSTAIALSTKARNHSIQVGIGQVEVLSANDKRCLWTDSLQSCFPVIFKFKNGDIGLLHGMSADISNVKSLLDRDDLEEIQLFEKGHVSNSLKVEAFAQNVINYYQKNHLKQPAINIQIQDHIASYGVTVCYKTPENEPVILVGDSIKDFNELTSELSECTNQEDSIHSYEFEDATKKFNLAPAPTVSTAPADKSHRFFEKKKNQADEDAEIVDTKKKSRHCTIL